MNLQFELCQKLEQSVGINPSKPKAIKMLSKFVDNAWEEDDPQKFYKCSLVILVKDILSNDLKQKMRD